MALKILMRGGGDLASGVAYRLARAGWSILISELPQPLAVRRLVSYAQAVYDGEVCIEGITGRLAFDLNAAEASMEKGEIAVMVDPGAENRIQFHPQVIIDARMTKQPPDLDIQAAALTIGLGPGFVAGENCNVVIETMRGPWLGHVYWQGSAEADTGQPEAVANRIGDRVLRAPASGTLTAFAEIGTQVEANQLLADISGVPVYAQFKGVLRGLIQPGIVVQQGVKIGDVDPRLDPQLCIRISDKALAVGGGVLEAILTREDLRHEFWAS